MHDLLPEGALSESADRCARTADRAGLPRHRRDDGSPEPNPIAFSQGQAAIAPPAAVGTFTTSQRFCGRGTEQRGPPWQGDLILFVDSDDVPARNAVARMREAITLSGDDALICASYYFASKKRPCDPATGEVHLPPFATCIPLGIDLVGGLLNPAAFGGSMFIIRRSVFEKMGGFRELRDAGHEDWEFYVRLALAGFRIDILPEMLQYYRQVEEGLARTLPSEPAKRRLLDAYEDSIEGDGLQGGALALAGLYRRGQEMEWKVRQLSMKAAHPSARYASSLRQSSF